MFLNLLEELSD